MAAAAGNQYAAKARVWCQAINKALAKRSKSDQLEALEEVADKLIDMALEGDISAIKELGDRLEGKPNQSISGPNEGPIVVGGDVHFVKPPSV